MEPLHSPAMLRPWIPLPIAALLLASCSSHDTTSRSGAADSTIAPAAAAVAADSSRAAAPPESAATVATDVTALPAVLPAGSADILAAVHRSKSPAVLVNVWATWCAPCRHEFPDLMKLARTYRNRGLDVILVSADFDDQMPEVRRFLSSQGVDFPTYLKNEEDMKFIDALDKRWTGALPATFVYDAQRNLRSFHEGQSTFEEFEQQVLPIMKPQPTSPKEEHS